MMKNYGMPVAAEGWPFILPLAVVTVLCFVFGWKNTGYVSLALTLFVLFFFRDPERVLCAQDCTRLMNLGYRLREWDHM